MKGFAFSGLDRSPKNWVENTVNDWTSNADEAARQIGRGGGLVVRDRDDRRVIEGLIVRDEHGRYVSVRVLGQRSLFGRRRLEVRVGDG